MKPITRRAFTAAGILAAAGVAATAAGCFDSRRNEPATVYGPPPEYDPSENENNDVYGPPPDEPDVVEESDD